ncbi:MAG: protein kinase, partial [Planctomycetota bacterium]|nr:protein kinase [Planctomycetota bacterium]
MDFKQLGPYKLKRQIGQGGMGTVFEAVHIETDEVVAVKSLATARSSDAKFRKRFESEINTLIELNHPNIVRILSHGQDQGHLYFAMQL